MNFNMKTYRFLFLFGILATVALQSCLKDDCERTVSYTYLEPVYKTLDEIHTGTAVAEAVRDLVNPGQLYYFNNHIYINERGEGIHIIDNTDPANPAPVSFLAIPGNEDLAIKNGVLYANTYTDLLAIDLQSNQLLGRTDNAFVPEWQNVNSGQILVDWKETPMTEVMDCATFNSLRSWNGGFAQVDAEFSAALDDFSIANEATSSQGSGRGTGVGGSMARFTIMGDYLYAIDESGMDLFDLGDPGNPAKTNRVEIGWGIETIFPYEDKLFIGSNSGMFIYDNSVPTAPVQLSAFAHARACDPVFVNGDYAYVTLRSGNECDGFTNQLDLVEITDLMNPVLRKTYPMDNPHGLTIRNQKLFLCEGEFGFKSFDITDPLAIDENPLDHEKGLHAFDAISLPGNDEVVMVIGEDGFYQYSVDAEGGMELLSKISMLK